MYYANNSSSLLELHKISISNPIFTRNMSNSQFKSSYQFLHKEFSQFHAFFLLTLDAAQLELDFLNLLFLGESRLKITFQITLRLSSVPWKWSMIRIVWPIDYRGNLKGNDRSQEKYQWQNRQQNKQPVNS